MRLSLKLIYLFYFAYLGFYIAPTKLVRNKIKSWLLNASEYDFTDIKEGIRLHLNESPFEPPQFIVDAVKMYLSKGNRYQHPEFLERYRELAAEYSKVEPENIYPSVGADGSIRAIFYNLIEPGDTIVTNYPSYSMYSVYSSVRGTKVIKVNLKEDNEWWRENIDDLLAQAEKAELVIIDDPNNPTGSPMLNGKRELIGQLAENAKGFVVIDEAYYEFGGYTVSPYIYDYPNVLVVRTLSKAFSLASYRLGYTIANEEIVKTLLKSSTPFDIPLPSLIAGITALENSSYIKDVIDTVSRNREILYQGLKNLNLKVYKSITNFLLIKDNRNLQEMLMRHGIAIRKLYDNFYRITVGTEEQCRMVIDKLGEELENSNSK
ncbi:MAG: histidinol-phosphate transaminase [Saccharolobus sp.]|uniref:Histidinol-phosphate aminotransferase n=1 Tax=Saccharolobus shibatae TaxID=2286 RepID=A0A8F5C3F6_9CREN|nr:histidinol-phosphate transaminase [Saccharolobus shibatae]MCH4814808.1 histidinol-phosphate transaminase [Saccharolobus shibatae]QXJ33159.1 Histidinol-phosphate aminotransferase [Saccharolobus shibatae]QXJ36276.1 Histidinol-phosphate aminotransferase [Saccharolobus shibatae]